MKVFILLALVAGAMALGKWDAPAITEETIRQINSDPESTWTAGWNEKWAHASLGEARTYMGALLTKPGPKDKVVDYQVKGIPDSFDARTVWPQCPTVGMIRDQSACGSCWAFGAVEAFSDRVCIASNGTFTTPLSALDLLACCDIECGQGCDGGYLNGAWNYFVEYGIVTGGLYGDKKTCEPYPFPPCDHHVNGTYGPCPQDDYDTPSCVPKCSNGAVYTKDKHKAKSAYSVSMAQASIMTEIMLHGPVECAFTVYSDFLTYKTGVYKHKTGSELGGHAVRMLGWGTENGTPYWIIANSWNEGWGDKGYFKILRGSDHCGIESSVWGGLPA